MPLFLILITILCFSFPAYADSTDTTPSQELTEKQKEELAKQMGLVLIGMTKEDVRETFGLIVPDILFTDKGQEVWFVEVPEPQIIYFKDDKVERVEYEPRPATPKIKQPKEI